MRKFSKLSIKIIVILFIVFFAVVLNMTGLSKTVKGFFYSVSSPIQKILWQCGDKISDFSEGVFKTGDLKKENEELIYENLDLMNEIAALQYLKKENEVLREVLEIGLQKDFKLILAQVVGKDLYQDIIFLNVGLSDGVEKNMPVINQQKTIIGKVDEVYKKNSRITIISSLKSSFDAKILRENGDIFGIVKGRGGSQIYLDLIPQEQEVFAGDMVTTSRLSGVFPEGLLVGRIKEVRKSDVRHFQQAEIQSSFKINELENLFIIKEY